MKIDFVIPWVDGGDPAWQEEKKQYYRKTENREDVSDARYRDWGELKYWFRGVEQFAPWVNRIFFITNGQFPAWLNPNHEKLVWVKHGDYIPKEYLPTFSSHPIELNFHRIEDLSEHFVYFNDDMFLTSPVSEDDYFRSGLPCGLAIESPVTADTNDIFNHILLNNCALLNNNYTRKDFHRNAGNKRFPLCDPKGLITNAAMGILRREAFFGFAYFHLPSPFLKSTLQEVWEDHEKELDEVCRHRFRSINDVNQYVFLERQYVTGKFEPYPVCRYGNAFHLNDSNSERNNIRQACDAIVRKKYKMICINESNVGNFEETKSLINFAFEQLLPDKCSFEL